MRPSPRTVTAAAAAVVLLGLTSCTPSSPAPTTSTSGPASGTSWQPGPAQYGAEVEQGRTIRMDDGVELRAAIAFPTDRSTGRRAAGRFPVVIEHSVYPEAVGFGSGPVDTWFTEHGYISVHVNSRGTGGSTGTGGFVGPREARDGAAVIDWAADELEGSDGRVAEVGCSWPGMQALADAATVGRDSPLKAVIAACSALGTVQRTDILVSGVPTGDFSFVDSAAQSSMDANRATRDWYRTFSDEVLAGGDAAYERDFWRQRIPIEDAQRIVDNDVPVLLWTGWQDFVGIGAVRSWTALQNAAADRPLYAPTAAGQQADPRYQLIIGDWGHAGGLDHTLALRWLETWVRGVDTGMQATTATGKLFEQGADRWVGTDSYPAADRATRFHLDRNATLTSAGGASGSDPVAFGDGTTLRYTGPSLPTARSISGPVSATIHATSTNGNLQLSATLLDVAPDGTVTEITHGSVLGSLREIDADRSWPDAASVPLWPWQTLRADTALTPGADTRLDIALEPRQWQVEAGHRLRFELTAQAGAQLTAPQQASLPGGRYRILLGTSTVNVPLVSPDALRTEPCATSTTSNGVCLPAR